ncbi:PCI-domain-containing protein [Obba rivulosa]|uniref:PCI-domain-containing protein n=1 Tax=Obba rivulosa TaxID=1052685 RepID=A0A8E2AWH9_9APHY|nr:PCI-domain-containing protein [Obba rivulosa]
MDIDAEETNLLSRNVGKPTSVPVDDLHPFELEVYAASYSGRCLVDRLTHIISLSPALALPAFQLALQELSKLRDIPLYRAVRTAYEQAAARSDGDLPPIAEVAPLDQKWIDETNTKNQAERQKLEVELKTYLSNMIKESIRMAHRDLGHFYRATGDHSSALKHLTKSREFCTTSQHVLDMCLSVLELLVEHRNYNHIATYIYKAEAALDASASAPPPRTAAQQQPRDKERVAAEREKVQSRLDVASGLAYLGQGNYEKAAQSFLKVGPIKSLSDWSGKLISPSDVAMYGALCALATMSRNAIRAQLLENETFGVYVEQEPYVRDLLENYMANRFKAVLETLERYSTRHLLDYHLYPHVSALTDLIRSRALVLYFTPFSSIKLARMGAAFGWSVEELEHHVVALIQRGEIEARVDRQNKVLVAKETDPRAALFTKAMKAGADMQAANRKLLLRMRLQQADLAVKTPKHFQQPVGPSQEAVELLG